MTTHIPWLRLLWLPTMSFIAVGGSARLFFTPLAAAAQAQNQPSSRAAIGVEGAWRLTETAIRSAGGMWEARPTPQGGLYVFTGRHYSYFY
jgi:hypothetical protein